ncbi:MAG: histidine-type phosphatase [Flavipsychrobacter sp.]|nr:histidine-type phosphatase [Flavipsychrobacter sp.]
MPQSCLLDYWGTKKLYQPADTGCIPAPAGYKAIFINYAGRHGARHLTNLNDLLLVQQTLNRAVDFDGLTNNGMKLKEMVNTLLLIEKKEYCGLLTETGKRELWGIGNRMKSHYRWLFTDSVFFRVVTTKEKRTKQSAQAFMSGVNRPMQQDTTTDLIDNDSIHLRFYEVSPGYRKFKKNGNWAIEINKLKHDSRAEDEKHKIINKFFTREYTRKLLHPVTDKMVMGVDTVDDFIDAIFNVATLTNAMLVEIQNAGYTLAKVNIRSLFTCDEFAWLEFVNSAQDYLLKGPGTDINGIQVRNAAPLLVDFINSTDEAIKNNKPVVVVRFAHAETLSPFAALTNIEGAATPTADIFKYAQVWNVSAIIGYSVNVQWILYKASDTGKAPLIQILYNEKPVHIPVATNQFPYYKWADVRAFYMDKLSKMNVRLDSDMLEYLKDLK